MGRIAYSVIKRNRKIRAKFHKDVVSYWSTEEDNSSVAIATRFNIPEKVVVTILNMEVQKKREKMLLRLKKEEEMHRANKSFKKLDSEI